MENEKIELNKKESQKKEMKLLVRKASYLDSKFEDRMKALQIKSTRDTFALAELFIEGFNKLNEDFSDEEKIKELLNKIQNMKKLRKLFDDYGDGKEFYSHWAESKIRDFVDEQREVIQKVANLFSKLYLENF